MKRRFELDSEALDESIESKEDDELLLEKMLGAAEFAGAAEDRKRGAFEVDPADGDC